MSYELKLQVGNDTGNSEHDIIINDVLICQPNVVARARKTPNLEELAQEPFIENIENNLVINLMSKQVPTGTYYIGDYALKSGLAVKSIEVGVDNNKAENDIVFINTLAQIAGFAVKQAYKEDKIDEDIKVKVDMTGSLPINQYTSKRAKRFAERFTDEIHVLNVETPNKSVKVEIEFEFVKILQEGVTTTFALDTLEDEVFESYNKKFEENKKNKKEVEAYNVKLSKEYFKNQEIRILHVSIGEGTSEYPKTIGKRFDPNFIHGSNNGVGIGIDKSLDEFKNEVRLSTYSRQQYSQVIKDKSHKYYPTAIDILDFHLEEQSAEILKNSKQEIERANNEIDLILVYGGGSILMRNTLEYQLEEVCNKGKMKLLYLDYPYAVTIESKGLSEFTKSKIFQVLKNKSKLEKSSNN
ncbi:ParM/StbA family protein [Paraclostridium bifermentans]|uniref:ParM/StbA family protein n=1 Tax=Paraclostridium bifermentans TaxID=1490 RepID=UPI00189ABB01|nr:ParM/StbA family protein [Paraclostridium bifermentans]